MLRDGILSVCNLQQCLLFEHRGNRKCNSETQISAANWLTVHEHIVAKAFCSKKSSSVLLVHKQQGIT